MILAVSCFLENAESDYVPVERRALAVAWYLEQPKIFTMGCNSLLVKTVNYKCGLQTVSN